MIKVILKKNIKFMAVSLIMSLIMVVATLSVPFLSNKIFRDITNIQRSDLYLLFGIMVLNYFIQIGLILLKEKVAVNVNSENLDNFMQDLFHVKYDTMINLGNNSLITKISKLTNSIYSFLIDDVNTMVSSILIIIGALIFVSIQNIYYGLILLAIIPFTFFGFKLINKKLSEKCVSLSAITSKNYQDFNNIYSNPDFLKQYSKFDGFDNLINKKIVEIFEAHKSVNQFAGAASSSIRMFNELVQNALLIWISYNVTIGNAKLYSIVVFTLVINVFFDSLYSLNGVNIDLTNLKVDSGFYKENILDNLEKKDGIAVENTISKVKFENPVVKILDTEFKFEINEEFYPSDIVYIDAKSGAGKSTLLRSLLNIRDVDGISINEKAVNSLSLDELREKVAYVPQNPLIIPASLRENILVDTVIDKSIDEKILSMDVLKPVLKNKNLDSEILANGENLSGGEKQRVSIVRSLMRDADVYIFDEITSNLDSESQEDFFSNFIKDIDNKIVFIISHDKKVQKYCNKTMHVK